MKKKAAVILCILLTLAFCAVLTGCDGGKSTKNADMCELCGKNPKYLGKLCSSCYADFAEWQEENGF